MLLPWPPLGLLDIISDPGLERLWFRRDQLVHVVHAQRRLEGRGSGDGGDAAPETLAMAEGRQRAREAGSGGMGGRSRERGGRQSATCRRDSPESAGVSGGGGEESRVKRGLTGEEACLRREEAPNLFLCFFSTKQTFFCLVASPTWTSREGAHCTTVNGFYLSVSRYPPP